jgi:nitrogen fixation NifU-like protein
MSLSYSKKVMEHFKDPKNMGEMEDADGIGEVGNPQCGDIMRVYIKVEKKGDKEYIKDIKFQTMGCIAAIATSSMTTELAKGKSLEEAKKITNKDVAESLGNLPPIKMHCSNLAANALRKAIEDYEKKKN